MPACLFGCDSLFELGYVAVNPDGVIIVSPASLDDPALGPRLHTLAGRRCETATDRASGLLRVAPGEHLQGAAVTLDLATNTGGRARTVRYRLAETS
jgi:hypothetical protein